MPKQNLLNHFLTSIFSLKKKIILSIYQPRLPEDLAMKKSKEFQNDEVFLSWSFYACVGNETHRMHNN
jgi:hypothetical protein